MISLEHYYLNHLDTMISRHTLCNLSAFLALVLAAVSCNILGGEIGENDAIAAKKPLPEVQVNTLNPLLADLSAFELTGNSILTKAGSGADIGLTVPLESLLDKSRSVSVEGIGGMWTETPIRDTESGYVFLSNEMRADYSTDQSSGVRKYLIESPYEYFIATMVPYYIFSEGDWSYFDREGFFGTVLLSTPEGELLEVRRYHPDGTSNAMLVTNPEDYDTTEVEYINIKGGTMTRSDAEYDGGCLTASVCVAEYNWDPVIPGGNNPTTFKDDTDNSGRNHHTGGGGGRPKNPKQYNLSLSVQGEGIVSGGGLYSAGDIVRVEARPSDDSDFAYWTGDLTGNKMWTKIKMPAKDISATAVFLLGFEKPCYDAETGTYFPIAGKAKIAPTSTGGRPVSGTYGDVRYNRDGSKKAHRGWDIEAVPGTPFYAPVEGEIAGDMWTSTPNGKKDRSGCGNRIGIIFNLCGRQYTVFFFHLAFTDKTKPGDPANGIGINPRTGRLWAPGDTVHPGEILGCTGDTGAAYNVDVKHLHVQIHNTQMWPPTDWAYYEDPSILFGDILTKDANGNVSGYDINNRCNERGDSEYQIDEVYDFYNDFGQSILTGDWLLYPKN